MAGFKGVSSRPGPLFLLGFLILLSSCWTQGKGGTTADVVTPEVRAQSLLVNLAVLSPRVAEPLVKGVSAAALERAVVLVVNTGVDEARWAEGLLNRRWWLLDDPSTRLMGADGVTQVLSEVHRMDPAGGSAAEERQREIREALGHTVAPEPSSEGVTEAIDARERKPASDGVGRPLTGPERRAELEDAVQWAQFTQAWSSYYEAVDAVSSGQATVPAHGSESALDQVVTMSLVRPDFLDRLAALMVEGLGS